MVDEEIKDLSAGPAGAPANRDARREPDVIEGQIAARGTDEHESPPDPPAAEPLPPAAPAPRAAAGTARAGNASTAPIARLPDQRPADARTR